MVEGFPRRFGKYHLLKPLAQGGMGALYLAVSENVEKLCAVKTVLPHLSDKEYIGRFRDETKVVVKLQHGNLVQVFDAGQVGGELYLAMEFIEGKDLRAVWNRCARKGIAFPIDVAVHIVKELCRGLAYAHSFGDLKLVHRDVSPPNVLLAYSGEIKLTDFGLASSTLKSEKTAPGVVYGKVSYMSPEQARGEVIDARSDLFTAGVLLWELLTGRQMFPQGDRQPGDLLQEVKHPKIEPPSSRASRVSQALDRIVVRALALEPRDRYQNGEEMRTALAEYLAQQAPTTDAARIASFLRELVGTDIEKEREARELMVSKLKGQLLAGARAGGAAGETTGAGAAVAAGAAGSAAPALAADPGSSGIIGSLIDGRYQVRSLIGEGGMGRVYEAEHVEIGKRVALKVLHPVYSRTPEVVERFRREARAASKIGHPNIVDVTDSGTTAQGSVYFAMEYLEGVELARVIADQGALDLERALVIASQICRAVAAAHARGIIHRDLKPENIFLVTREQSGDFVKVLDFGIAKTAELEEARERRLTNPGMAMGTPEYMAPEQAAGKPYDHRVDVYATGAILYEMLCGTPPFDGDNFMEILNKKATCDPLPPREIRTDLPEEIERVVLRALAKNPDERPPSMEAFDYEITKAQSGRAAAVVRLLGLPPALAQEGRAEGSRPPGSSVGGPATDPIAVGASARAGRRMATWMVGGALGLVIVVAGVIASRRPAGGRTADLGAAAGPPGPATASVGSGAPASGSGGAAEPAPAGASPTAMAPVAAAPAPAVVPAPTAPSRAAPHESGPAVQHRLADARRALAGGHYAEARQSFQRLLTTRERAAALVGLGEIAFQQQSYGDAARLGRQALAAGAGAPAHVLLGNAYFRQQKYDDSIHEYKTVLKTAPNHPEARRGLDAAKRRQAGG